MGQRLPLKEIAEQTLKDLELGYYVDSTGRIIPIRDDVQQSIDRSQLFSPAALDKLLLERTRSAHSYVVNVVRASTLQGLVSLHTGTKKIAVLNFASAKNPGGGFLGGSQAQEESLARSGSLYPTLLRNSGYYEVNRRASDSMYTDNLIYSPDVAFFKNDNGDYLDEYVKSDVITMPAVNRGALKTVNENIQMEIDETMRRRIRYVLAASEKNKVEILILGAWGCGVFKNDPMKIAENFKDVLNEEWKFDIPRIVFAVIDRDGKTYEAFTPLASAAT